MFQKIVTFIKESRIELQKVTWPTRDETVRYTATVILISAVIAVFLGGLDYLFRYLLNTFIL